MSDQKVTPARASGFDRRNGTSASRAQDHGIDAVIRIDATIVTLESAKAALLAQRAQVIATNRIISGRASA